MIKRKLRWNKRTITDEQTLFRFKYIFAILNQPREIDRIKQRTLVQLAPAGELHVYYNNLLPGTDGLHCEIFSFSSNIGRIEEPKKIYDSDNFMFDRNLREGDEGELENYVQSLKRG